MCCVPQQLVQAVIAGSFMEISLGEQGLFNMFQQKQGSAIFSHLVYLYVLLCRNTQYGKRLKRERD